MDGEEFGEVRQSVCSCRKLSYTLIAEYFLPNPSFAKFLQKYLLAPLYNQEALHFILLNIGNEPSMWAASKAIGEKKPKNNF